jgi:uncharacterized membrane protein YdjX (TVP38/TMEM64 family)
VTDRSAANKSAASASPGSALKRAIPLIVVLVVPLVAYAFGLQRYASLEALARHYDSLSEMISAHYALAVAAYIAIYTAAIALSLPLGLVLTLSGGLLLGWQVSAPATVVGATAGASILFLIARSSLGHSLAQQAGPWLDKLAEGFRQDAFSYLLFLRLVPAVPFVICNLVPAVLGVPFSTYVFATLLGIIPATFAYSFAGSGLGSVISAETASYKACLAAHPGDSDTQCHLSVDASSLFSPGLVYALLALAAVALLPVILKRIWDKKAPGAA